MLHSYDLFENGYGQYIQQSNRLIGVNTQSKSNPIKQIPPTRSSPAINVVGFKSSQDSLPSSSSSVSINPVQVRLTRRSTLHSNDLEFEENSSAFNTLKLCGVQFPTLNSWSPTRYFRFAFSRHTSEGKNDPSSRCQVVKKK